MDQVNFDEKGNLNKPSKKEDPFIKGSSGLLKKAAAKIRSEIGVSPIKVLRDQNGIFAIEYKKWFVTANKYLYKGTILSNQKEMVLRAHRYQKGLLVYIGEDDLFFLFDPNDILDQHWENERGYIKMYNWNVNLGRQFLV